MRFTDLALRAVLSAVLLAPAAALGEVPVELPGSPESMIRQHRIAAEAGYPFVATLGEMERLVREGRLVPIPGGPDYEVASWVFPYGLPEVRTFVERFAEQYHRTCGEPLVVTSLTRPFSEQPPNAHELSVHPAGMAVDLRISQTQACRQFLEAALLEKERSGLLDVTRERAPPHYHIAIFPGAYAEYVDGIAAQEAAAAPPRAAVTTPRERPGTPGAGVLLLYALLMATALGSIVLMGKVRKRGGGEG